MHWDLAPENPGRLAAADVQIALTSQGLKKPEDFLRMLRQAVARGLKPDDALRALTVVPAGMFGVGTRAGTLEPGKMAHFVVTDGDLFAAGTRVLETWIDGRRYEVKEEKEKEKEKEKEQVAHPRALFEVNFPLGEQGRASPLPEQPAAVLFRNAVVWTCGPQGVLREADVLVRAGKIAAVGDSLQADDAQIVQCQGRHLTPGLVDCHSHIAITGGITDSGKATTGEVRIADVINSDDPELYLQLAGGVTCLNLLPGSDNTIAGQNQVIKVRWGALPEEMKLAGATPGLKLALGENAKRSNWGSSYPTRYPQTRMGVEQLLLDRFRAAEHYRRSRETRDESREPGNQNDSGSRLWTLDSRLSRPDLELEALAEVLSGGRMLHCHAYRQDEILAYVRLCGMLGMPPGTLHHASESYKVADLLRAHGVGVSSFSDWWAFKFEVYDAIPHNAAMLARAGVTVSINSDNAETARRLNTEAAKAVKYGNLSEEEALKLVTLYPARQVGIDRQLGSLEAGKDADLVLWSGPPLSTVTRCEQTWIDGRRYFDRDEDLAGREEWRRRRAALIQRVLSDSQ